MSFHSIQATLSQVLDYVSITVPQDTLRTRLANFPFVPHVGSMLSPALMQVLLKLGQCQFSNVSVEVTDLQFERASQNDVNGDPYYLYANTCLGRCPLGTFSDNSAAVPVCTP